MRLFRSNFRVTKLWLTVYSFPCLLVLTGWAWSYHGGQYDDLSIDVDGKYYVFGGIAHGKVLIDETRESNPIEVAESLKSFSPPDTHLEGFYFKWSYGFEIVLPCWFLAIFAAFPPMLYLIRRRVRPGVCPRCGYDLRATPDRCPECGLLQVSKRKASARGLEKR